MAGPSLPDGTPYRRDARTLAAFGLLLGLGLLQATLGVVLPYLRDELDLDYTAASLHVTAFAVGGFVAGLSGAAVAARVGRRWLVVAGAGGSAAAALLLTLAGSAALTLASALLLGLTLTWAFVALWSALSDQHGDRRAVALSEGEVGVSLGTLSLPLVVSASAALGAGWRAGLLVAALAPVAGVLAVRAAGIAEPLGEEDEPADDAAAAVRSATRGRGRLVALLAITVCVVGLEWTLSTWLISYFDDDVGLERETAVALGSGFFAAMLAGRLIASRIARRRYAGDVFLLALGTVAVGVPLLVAVTEPAVAVAGSVVAGLGAGALFPLASALVLEAAGPRSTAGSGATLAAASVGVLLAPLAIGALADAFGLRGALACTMILPALTAAIALSARRARLRTLAGIGVG